MLENDLLKELEDNENYRIENGRPPRTIGRRFFTNIHALSPKYYLDAIINQGIFINISFGYKPNPGYDNDNPLHSYLFSFNENGIAKQTDLAAVQKYLSQFISHNSIEKLLNKGIKEFIEKVEISKLIETIQPEANTFIINKLIENGLLDKLSEDKSLQLFTKTNNKIFLKDNLKEFLLD